MKTTTQRKLLMGIGMLLALYFVFRLMIMSSDYARINKAQGLYNKGDIQGGLDLLGELEPEILASNDQRNIAYLYMAKANGLLKSSRENASFEEAKKALAAAEKSVSYLGGGDKQVCVQSIMSRGMIYSETAIYENGKNKEEAYLKAVDDFRWARKLYKRHGNVSGAFNAEWHRGVNLRFLALSTDKQEYAQNSIDAMKSAIAMAPPKLAPVSLANAYINLGQSYQASHWHNNTESVRRKSIAAHKKALELVGIRDDKLQYLQTVGAIFEAWVGFAYVPDRRCGSMSQCYDDNEVNRDCLVEAETFIKEELGNISEREYPLISMTLKAELGCIWFLLAPFWGDRLYFKTIESLENFEKTLPVEPDPIFSQQLGRAYYRYGLAKHNAKHLRSAVHVLAEIVDEAEASSPLNLSILTDKGLGHLALYQMSRDTEELLSALYEFRQADSACNAERFPDVCFITGYNLGDAYAELAGQADPEENRQKAIAAYKKSLTIPGLDSGAKRYKRVQEKLQKVQALAAAP